MTLLNFARIPPLPNGSERPFWSVMIPTHNCGSFLVEALESVLQQDPGPAEMQIVVLDDCSTEDDPESVVKEVGQNRVAFFRQVENVGATDTFNNCLRLARGLWVHLLHADDKVLPGFYSEMRAAITDNPAVGAAFCRHAYIDDLGRMKSKSWLERDTGGILPEDFLDRLALSSLVMAPSVVVRRDCYEKLGGFHPELSHCADWEMWKRITVQYPVFFHPKCLACYRQHAGSDTSRLIRSGANIADSIRAIEISRSYLPDSKAAKLSNAARNVCARYAFDTARRLFSAGDAEGAMAQIREGLKCSDSSKLLRLMVELLRRILSDPRLPIPIQGKKGDGTQETGLAVLRLARRQIADKWLSLSGDKLEAEYLGDLRLAHNVIRKSGVASAFLTESELAYLHELQARIASGFEVPTAFQAVLAAELFLGIHLTPVNSQHLGISRPRNLPRRVEVGMNKLWSLVSSLRTLFLEARLVWEQFLGRTKPVIALVVRDYFPRLGGSQFHVKFIARALKESGYRPLIVAERLWGEPLTVEGIPVVMSSRILQRCDLLFTYSANAFTRQVSNDLHRLNRRLAWVHHPCAVSKIGLEMIAKADKIAAFNQWDVELTTLVCGSPSKAVSIPPSSHESRIGTTKGFRSKMGTEADYILWAGAWLPAKGPRNLSERFILFRNRHRDINVKLVMFGGYGNLEFPTPHPDIVVINKNSEDLPSAIKECLFVAFNSPPHPVGYDANPLILLEALMHGKTFVAQAGTPFLPEIKNLGIVVNSDSEWIGAVETLIFNSEKRHALERACYKAYLEKYNFRQMMVGIESVLSELLTTVELSAGQPGLRRERSQAID